MWIFKIKRLLLSSYTVAPGTDSPHKKIEYSNRVKFATSWVVILKVAVGRSSRDAKMIDGVSVSLRAIVPRCRICLPRERKKREQRWGNK